MQSSLMDDLWRVDVGKTVSGVTWLISALQPRANSLECALP
jgi:hypothetical protein